MLGECREKLARELLRVDVADAESYQRPDVPENRMGHALRKLMDILVGEDEAEPILPSFRQYGRENIRREILKFVYIKIEVLAVFFDYILPLQCRKVELRNEHGAEQVRLVLAD